MKTTTKFATAAQLAARFELGFERSTSDASWATTDALRGAEADALVADLTAAGIEATKAYDTDDRSRAWVYASLDEVQAPDPLQGYSPDEIVVGPGGQTLADVASAVHVDAAHGRPSTCVDITGALDVEVTVTIGGRTIEGEVTLAPRQYDGQLAAYGSSPDHWISGGLLAALRRLDDDAFRAACDAIEAAAQEAA